MMTRETCPGSNLQDKWMSVYVVIYVALVASMATGINSAEAPRDDWEVDGQSGRYRRCSSRG
jgi:hypothetical protein